MYIVPEDELQMHMDRHLAEQLALEEEMALQANNDDSKTHVKVSE